MADYDLAVPEEQFDRALALLLDSGNTLRMRTAHAASLMGSRDEIDLHRWIFKWRKNQFHDIWEHAEKFRFYGVDVCVPTSEDMFIHLLDMRSRDYFRLEKPTRQLQWFGDCRDLWEHSRGVDLECLAVRAQELHVTARVRMMLRVFMQCFPELIEPEEFDRCFPRTPEYDKLLVNGEKFKNASGRYRSYGYDEQSAVTPIHIWRGLQFEFIHYRYLKPELQWAGPNINFFRFIKLVYGLDGLPDLAKGYLSRIRLFEKRDGGD